MYLVADRLNKTVDELQAITVDEFNGWIAYIEKEREGGASGNKSQD